MAHGRVLERGDGRPIPNATVTPAADPGSRLDQCAGPLCDRPRPRRELYARVEADGFAVGGTPGLRRRGRRARGRVVRLTPATAELAEIVVATSRYALDRFGTSGAVQVTGDTLAAQPAPGEDAMRTLGRLPGMAQGGLSAQSNIRGSEAGELLTLSTVSRCAKPSTCRRTTTFSA